MNTISQNRAQSNHSEDEINLLVLWYQILEHKWFIAAVTSCCLSLGILYSYLKPPQYQASVLLQVNTNTNTSSKMLSGLGGFVPSFGQDRSIGIQMALMQSRYILEPVIEELGLNISIKSKSLISQIFSSSLKAKIGTFQIPSRDLDESYLLVYDAPSHIKLFNKKEKMLLEGQVGHLLKSLDKTIKIKVDSVKAPVGSKFILKKISLKACMEQLSKKLKISDLGKKHNETGILELLVEDKHSKQSALIANKIANIAQRKDIEKSALEASKTLDFLYQQLPLAKQSLEQEELMLNKYRSKSTKINIKLQTSELVQRMTTLDKKLETLRLKKINMRQKYTPKHPLIISLNQQIIAIKKEIHRVQNQLKKLPESDQIAFNMMRDGKVKRSLYVLLYKKIHELEAIKASTMGKIQILSYAQIPYKPLPSKAILISILSLFLGLFLSISVILIRKLFFPFIEDPNWIEEHLNLTNLAIIPYSKNEGLKNKKNTSLLAFNTPDDLSVESLRSLRATLQINLKTENNNIISIMGPCPNVGKTFIAANLAYLLASANQRVLFIDADLRRGSAHKYFGLVPNSGLSELIQGSITSEIALKKSIHPNLTVLTRGNYVNGASELLSSKRCIELINNFAQQFDVVIIDTPPVLLVADAVLIGKISTINYLVLGAKVHVANDIKMVMKRLSSGGVGLNGSIYNFHNAESQKHSFFYKQRNYYSYYEDEKSFS